MKFTIGLFVASCCWPALAANPFAGGDAGAGKGSVEKACDGCHASLHGGDPNKIYTRPDRKVKNAQQLLTQVRLFSTNTHAGWKPQDELNAAAYLNQSFYRF
jgi:hypothetical protein